MSVHPRRAFGASTSSGRRRRTGETGSVATAWRRGLAVCSLLSLCIANAATPRGDAAERERISAERAVVETRFAEERLACERNFVVTSCVDAARKRERDGLARLRRQEALLDEAQRRQRAAERIAAIRTKVSAEEDRRREQAAQPRRERPLLPQPPSAGPAPAGRAASAPAPRSATANAQREARNRARFDARQREAREHRDAAQRRTAQRVKQGHAPAAPLPVPGAASAP
jgi:colicin import membrane protein